MSVMIRRSIWNWIGVLALIVGVAAVQTQVKAQETKPAQETAKKKTKAKKTEGMMNSASRAQESAGTAASQTAEKPAKAARQAPHPVKNASAAEISAAEASGKVWVNTETGVYHKSGKWYGATQKGKFMTEDEAKKAGYRASKQ